MSEEVLVFQVRQVNAHGDQRIIHAYETEEQAKDAIAMMKLATKQRYIYIKVPNDPAQYWGINTPNTK